MKLLKIYGLKISAVIMGALAGILYLAKCSTNIVITVLAVAGVLIFIDSKINKGTIYQQNLEYMKDKMDIKK